MKRYFLDIAYMGHQFHGWQIQPNADTIQAQIQKAMAITLRETVNVVGSGRTDTGVHAIQQYAHFDTALVFDLQKHLTKWNAILPSDISIRSIQEVASKAHARFDATKRSYVYQIQQAHSPFYQNAAYYYTYPLDINAMNDAASLLLEHKDFESFSKVKTEVKTFLCDISEAYWEEKVSPIDGQPMLYFHISANRFLRGMVRAIVGTLLEVGRGNISKAQFDNIILAKDRGEAGRAAPPQGLYLAKVRYSYIYEH